MRQQSRTRFQQSVPGYLVAVTAERDADMVTVAVYDSGIGIPAAMLTRVFEPFTQLDRSLERSRGGLGIGLALAKRLVDIGMPKLNGYEVARELRQQPWGRDVLLIAVTGWGGADHRQQTAQAGFDHHLTKPVDPAALTRLLVSPTDSGGRRPGGQGVS